MKLSTRYIAFAVALGAAGVASAQIEFYFAYGSAHIAALQTRNWAGIGSATDPTAVEGGRVNTTKLYVPKAGDMINGVDGGFDLWVVAKNTGSTAITGRNGGNVFIGMNQSVGAANSNVVAGQNQGPAPADWALAPSTDPSDWAGAMAWVTDPASVNTPNGSRSFATVDILGSVQYPFLRRSSVDLAGASGTSTSTRAAGISYGFTTGTGASNAFSIEPGQVINMFKIHLRSRLTAGTIYGDDAGEYGLGLPTRPNGGTSVAGANGFGNTGAHSGMLLDVQAVPEPGTMLALGAGLAAVAARRRRKN